MVSAKQGMSSRTTILNRIRGAEVPANPLPALAFAASAHATTEELVKQFTVMLQAVGGQVIAGLSRQDVSDRLLQKADGKRLVNTCSWLTIGEAVSPGDSPHALHDVFLAVVPGLFGVAENGAVWVAEEHMQVRALPFICEHLALVVEAHAVVADMHVAYERLEALAYPFGVFIAGPSKTADIEQSLVLGAHGARTLTVYLV
jgi:L-lactate dehydrogenase complex protein LldG